MKLKIITLFFTIFTFSASYAENKIIAVVNSEAITCQQLAKYKNLLDVLKIPKESDKKILDELILQNILIKFGQDYDLKASSAEIASAIEIFEKEHKLKSGALAKICKEKGLGNILLNKVKSEIILAKILDEVIPLQVKIGDADIQQTIVSHNAKDVLINGSIYYIDNTNPESYKKLVNIRNKFLANTKKINAAIKNSDIKIDPVSNKLANFTEYMRGIINNINSSPGVSSVVKHQGKVFFVYLESKTIDPISSNEYSMLSEIIGQKKMGPQFHRYINILKKRANVRILDSKYAS